MRADCGKVIFVNRFFHPDLSATSQLLSDLAFDMAADRAVVVITSALRYDDAARLPSRECVRNVEVRRIAPPALAAPHRLAAR